MHQWLPLVAILAAMASPSDGVDLSGTLEANRRSFQVRTARFDVPPARERELCQAVALPNREQVDIDGMVVDMPSAGGVTSHHFAMFIVGDPNDPNLPLAPEDNVGCVGVGGELVSPILAFTQAPHQKIRLPKGVVITIEPHQMLLLNPHYVNGSSDAATVDIVASFHRARKRKTKHHARSFQLGTLDIDVAPQSSGSAVASWIAPFPMNVVWLSTHSHKHTTSVDVEVLRAGVSQGLELRTDDWAEPNVNRYQSPFLRLEAGDGLQWTCNYQNDTDAPVTFGITASDEMCFAVGFFFTDDDLAPLPSVPGCFGNGRGLVCPLN